jgi:hypothetical protein
MAFGVHAATPQANKEAGPSSATEVTPAERMAALRDALLGLLKTATGIADAVRAEGTVSMPAIAEEPDPETGPLAVKGFHEHFAFVEGGRIGHALLASRDPDTGLLDPNLQFHLYELMGRILELNLFCQQAHIDEALGVALQSPHVPELVDAILVSLGFFAGLADNLAAAAEAEAAGAAVPTLDAQKASLERHVLMASDKMLDQSRLQSLLPIGHWPFVGVLVPAAPEAGDCFINGVYFPAEHARLVLAAAAQQGRVASGGVGAAA